MKPFSAAAIAVWLPLGILAAPAPDPNADEGKKVGYELHDGHFQRNDAGLKGNASYLVLGSREAFDKIFGIARVIGKQNFVPRDAFEKKMVVAVIKRGAGITQYQMESVTARGETVQVRYKATMDERGGDAQFASPLILTLDRDHYKSVVFIENGKKVETVKVEK